MNIDNKVLSEVYAIINALGETYKQRIPADVFDIISNQRDKNYSPIIDANKRLNEQELSCADDTTCFIAMLHRDYWCDTEDERLKLTQLFKDNEANFAETLKNATNTRDLLRMLHNN
jgi:hypothetical protein